ncbi:hypothetical protein BB560_004286 [Smittium megazygosporum]|uniref:Protein kinase domain-containing protein n=1 Tax=Smittium megazygosporum TaxID=133381 RepID=A0A2T9Z9Q4_9FUNG|nr:hypothetical protein BB560_004286 [Smittium megazygosporum]
MEDNYNIKYAAVEKFIEEGEGEGIAQVNQYRFERLLGSGASGVVYLAKDILSGEQYAIKSIRKSSLRKQDQVLLLKEEKEKKNGSGFSDPRNSGPVRIGDIVRKQKESEKNQEFYLIRHELAVQIKLNHPNLVKLYEVLNDDENDSIHMVFDYCENGPVYDIKINEQSKPLTTEKARYYFNQALMGIEYYLKPSNMLLTKDDILKISDFDNSRIVDIDTVLNENSGTPAFMAPELCSTSTQNDEYAADIWALGVVLYSFSFGKLPFSGTTHAEISASVVNDDLTFPNEKDERLIDLLRKILNKDPEERIKLPEIRNHSWVTNNELVSLPPPEENSCCILGTISSDDLKSVFKTTANVKIIAGAIISLRRIRNRIREKRVAFLKEHFQGYY